MSMLNKYNYHNGVLKLYFSDNYLRYSLQQYTTRYPNDIGQYPNTAFEVIDYVCEMYRIQTKTRKKKGLGNYVCMKIKTLFKNIITIPTEKEVKEGNRHYDERMVLRLDRALDDIESREYFKSIYYCNSIIEPLTEEQLKDGEFMKYQNFKTLSVVFVFKDYNKPKVNEGIRKQKLFK
ncbi:hypothetical protein AGMMS49936_11170 [Endomicrobiia bacterium]|nr:hypothetical protein AGMMS49936_11170 [Endomicrobiia bacterium]